jgi:hypothetical protein
MKDLFPPPQTLLNQHPPFLLSCGPKEMNEAVQTYAKELGHSNANIFLF